ncbi:MAG: alkaline phosphatase D family protein [Bacteroidota bacterium]|nr:alkaline phosphatase D family protein [Bacteroidota bacterium]
MVALLILFLLSAGPTIAQVKIAAGPMVGFADMREVHLWVQTTSACRVTIRYADTAQPTRWFWTLEKTTRKEEAFTARLVADSVEPGKVYRYQVYLNGQVVERPYPLLFRTPPLWQWRSDPPPFRFALGSCAYINDPPYDRPGKPYGGDYHIFRSIAAQQPVLFLWLGDNVYLREPDWNTWTGILHRYSHDRAIEELQPLLGACSNIAIWDDHDYGPNDSDRGFWNKEQTRRAFDLFWANPPSALQGGITTKFSWGDCDFFLLDDRWWRSPNNRKSGERTILGQEQFRWLIDNLVSSTATFKFVCIGGQVLNPVARYENYATYPEERRRLIEAIRQEGIRNVIFLTGDRHHTELTRYAEGDSLVLYDLTVSPLTSGPNTNAAAEPNTLRVEGTIVTERNFATIDVEGPARNRRLRIRVFDSNGVLKWERIIEAQYQ